MIELREDKKKITTGVIERAKALRSPSELRLVRYGKASMPEVSRGRLNATSSTGYRLTTEPALVARAPHMNELSPL